MRRLFFILLPLAAACALQRIETESTFASYTKGVSVPVYGPDGAVGDNEPEHVVTLLARREGRLLDHAVRLSVGEGTLTTRPQQKITVYSATWAWRLERPLAARFGWETQAGPRIAVVDNLGAGGVEFGPDMAAGLRLHTTEKSSVALLGGLWWTPGGHLPHGDLHARFGFQFGFDF